MNTATANLDFLELSKKASSKDYSEEDIFESAIDNPETNCELDLPSGVWRTNLLIEEEFIRKDKTLLLVRLTSIEDQFPNTSFFIDVRSEEQAQ